MAGKHQIWSSNKRTRQKAGRKWRRQARETLKTSKHVPHVSHKISRKERKPVEPVKLDPYKLRRVRHKMEDVSEHFQPVIVRYEPKPFALEVTHGVEPIRMATLQGEGKDGEEETE